MARVDPRTPCVVGVATRAWHPRPDRTASAPEPLEMWAEVATAAATDSGGRGVLAHVDSARVVYCQTWQYDDPVRRLASRLGIDPGHREYSGIGGTVPQQLVADAAGAILRGEQDLVLVVGAEALATRRATKRAGGRYRGSFPPQVRPDFPWEAPFHASEVAHDVFQAWLTFAIFDNARRARLGIDLDEYRRGIGEMLAPLTEVAAANPDAWYRIARSPQEIVDVAPHNRMVGYPYTKYMISVMDVDMAAALVVASHESADALGVPPDHRVYLRGWCYATDPVYVAEHPDLTSSPAMAAAAAEALRVAHVDVDDVAHLDLYSCFPSSLHFARDALGLAADDARPLTVTGGLPYHGGAGSNYVTHAIATMTRVLREDPGSLGLVSGVGMHMTKHAFGVYSSAPASLVGPDEPAVQAHVDGTRPVPIVECYEGRATVAGYSVVHGPAGGPEWAVVVADVPGGGRAYARADDPDLLAAAEATELGGRDLELVPEEVDLVTGGRGVRHRVRGRADR